MLSGGRGLFLSDEVIQSGNPQQHASDIIANMQQRQFHWVCQQVLPDMDWGRATSLLAQAAANRGFGAVGCWAQGLDIEQELAAVRAVAPKISLYVPNVESAHEDRQWTDDALNELLGHQFRDGLGVIFTEGAWGRDKEKAKRWVNRNFVGIPEAIVSENPQATIPAMLDLANQLGFDPVRTAPCLYITRGYKASGYNETVDQTQGRLSIFRYGDIDQEDWDTFAGWPVPTPAPAPEPPTPEPAKRTASEVYEDIHALMFEPVSDGGFSSEQTRGLIIFSAASWKNRQEYVGNAVSSTQRIICCEREAVANNDAWKKAGPGVDKALRDAGL